MTAARLFLAPAGAGKTAYCLQRARMGGLQQEARVVVASRLQARAWRRRLAEAGGALGVRLMTFDELYDACLGAAGESYVRLREPVQFRLIRAVMAGVGLVHFRPLIDQPGFVLELQEFIGELKAAGILPDTFLQAAGDEPRLRELGQIYAAYQGRLREQDWADYAGIGWLAVETVGREAQVGRDWPLLLVDGFDNFTQVQLQLLASLADRVGECLITLSGVPGDGGPRPVHGRFAKTRARLEQALKIAAEPLPESRPCAAPVIAHLERGLFDEAAGSLPAEQAVQLIEAADRAAEARAALRWLKEQIFVAAARPGEIALLARDMAPYRPFVLEAAAEFGLPLQVVEGQPLAASPVIAALLNLLALARPAGDGPGLALPRRGVIEAWRSPYFDWLTALPAPDAPEPIGITPEDADDLDNVARWGQVMRGQAQWEEVFDGLVGYTGRPRDDDELRPPENLPIGARAAALQARFRRFLARIAPPAGRQPMRVFVAWLETLVGPEEAMGRGVTQVRRPTALRVMARAREGDGSAAAEDEAALHQLKEILRGLLWAAEALDASHTLVAYADFLAELVGAVNAAAFRPPFDPHQEAILVANVIQARGLPLRAVALLGLSEGEFPATLAEDPLLPEADRLRLREAQGLPVDSAIESAEREFFYEAVTRPWERLLLTRPCLSDTGADWLASPFWEEARRLVAAEPLRLSAEGAPRPAQAASWAELMESLVAHGDGQAPAALAAADAAARWARLGEAGAVFRARYGRHVSPFNGDLTGRPAGLDGHFGPAFRWSPTKLETYRRCPHSFLIGSALPLERREEPKEGADVAQYGTLVHEILRALYEELEPDRRNDLEALLATLPAVAGRLLDSAPRRHGFRETAYWLQTRQETEQIIERTVRALAELPGDFTPTYFEQGFGRGQTALVVDLGDSQFQLAGFIDRIDRDRAGRLRIIDYKTSGPYAYDARSLEEGKRLQLPLYAAAARDALRLGEPVEGFYWHVRQAEASGLKLGEYGPRRAIEAALAHSAEAVRAARAGRFAPEPPADGCPSYCAAAEFCWQYRPGSWG